MQGQIPRQREFVKVHRHLLFTRRMLSLKAFSWHGATTAQLLVCSSHSLDKQHILQMADGGSLCGEELCPQTPHKEESGLP